jgi:outer membrane protein assembly factor BamE (lipoprotein component of BamABCDE complex)
MRFSLSWFVMVFLVWCGTSCSRLLFQEKTYYAPGFSEGKFQQIHTGATSDEVLTLLGHPLHVGTQSWRDVWSYYGTNFPSVTREKWLVVSYHNPMPVAWIAFDRTGGVYATDGKDLRGLTNGHTKADVLNKWGEPDAREEQADGLVYSYSRPGKSGTYKVREIIFAPDDLKVIAKRAYMYFD